MQSVLVLSASFQPLSIVPAKRAIQLMQEKKAEPLNLSGRFLHSATQSIEIPYVVLLTYMVKQGTKKKTGFSRHGVLARDNHKCLYCGNHATTIDHVIPKALGGKSTYDNCVAACQPCNAKKANKTLSQLGWKEPERNLKSPSHLSHMLLKASKDEQKFDVWSNYIYMYDPRLQPIG
jgi:5-methylcytosine-specific restriction endonuclease McrA